MAYNKNRINYFFQLPFGFYKKNELILLSTEAKLTLLQVMELASNNSSYCCQINIGLDRIKRLKAEDIARLLSVDGSIIGELIDNQLVTINKEGYCYCTYAAQFFGKENVATTRLREKKVKEQLSVEEQAEVKGLVAKLYQKVDNN